MNVLDLPCLEQAHESSRRSKRSMACWVQMQIAREELSIGSCGRMEADVARLAMAECSSRLHRSATP